MDEVYFNNTYSLFLETAEINESISFFDMPFPPTVSNESEQDATMNSPVGADMMNMSSQNSENTSVTMERSAGGSSVMGGSGY